MQKIDLRSIPTTWVMFLLGLLFMVWGQAASAEPLRIGATVSNTGKYQATSKMMQDAYKMWAQQVNRAGGLLGRRVELIFHDDKSELDRVSRLYERLIAKDRVDLVLSPYGSPLTTAAAEITERHGFVLLASAASARNIWEKGYKQVFGVYATADRYLIGFLDILARKHLRSVAIGYENSSFAVSAAKGAVEWSKKFGLNVLLFEAFNKNDANLPDLLSKMQATGAEAVILCAYPPEGYRFLALMHKAAYRPRATCFTIAPALQEFYAKAGTPAEHVFGPSQWEADERVPFPGTRQFIKDYQRYAGRQPSYHAGSAFAACQILERAINDTRSFDHEKISEFIRSLDTVTVIGRFKVDPTGRQVGHNPILIQWQLGKKQIVYPPKMRTAAPIFEPASGK